jgi:hypothetical protein
MNTPNLILTAGLLATLPMSASSGIVSDTLGSVTRYTVLATRLRTEATWSPGDACWYGPVFSGGYGGLCVTTASLVKTVVSQFYSPPRGLGDSVVATATTGTALKVPLGPPGGLCTGSYVEGDVVTGGGAVVGSTGATGVVDISGTRPEVGACAQAAIEATTASAAFAAMSATQALGDVVIRPGESRQISVTDGAVIQMNSLRLIRGPYVHQDVGGCIGKQAHLAVFGTGPGQEAVINTNRFELGDCAFIDGDVRLLVNVLGPGRAVRVGISAGDDSPRVAILAPKRSIVVRGPGFEVPDFLGNLWGANVTVTGHTDSRPTFY